MTDDNVFYASIQQHVCRDFAGVSTLFFEVHVLCANFNVCAFYSFYYRHDVDCRYAVNYVYIIRFYKVF